MLLDDAATVTRPQSYATQPLMKVVVLIGVYSMHMKWLMTAAIDYRGQTPLLKFYILGLYYEGHPMNKLKYGKTLLICKI